MPPPYQIIGWEPSISPHKASFYEALVASGRVSKVTYVAEADLSEDRKKQGWHSGSTNHLEMVVKPTVAEAQELVRRAPAEAIHLFSGVRGPILPHAIAAAIVAGSRFGLMREPRDGDGIAGLARFAHSWITEGSYRRHADFVLAIGRNGPPWFLGTGYRASRIFPFAYFLPARPESAATTSDELPVVAFLGRLEPEKGVQLILEAIKKVNRPARYVFAGSGSLAEQIRADQRETVSFVGTLPMLETHAYLSRADIICAPSTSKNDGWCAVVSEALLAGAAVLTTPPTGASICIEQDERLGRVVRAESNAVAAAIDNLLSRRETLSASRGWRKNWAHARLTDTAGATNLINILDHIYHGTRRPEPFYA